MLEEILAPLLGNPRAAASPSTPHESVDPSSPDATLSRGEYLRRKHAQLIADATRVGLRPAISAEGLALLRQHANPRNIPSVVVDLYGVSDGEYTKGAFLPSLRFLTSSDAIRSSQMEQVTVHAGGLPAAFGSLLPLFTDELGNSIHYVTHEASNRAESPALYFCAEALEVRVIAPSIGLLLEGLMHMRSANLEAGRTLCSGDFRRPSPTESRLLKSVWNANAGESGSCMPEAIDLARRGAGERLLSLIGNG